MNLFFAMPLPGELKAELGSLPRPPFRAAWAGAEGLHLTLAFLGPWPEPLGSLGEILASCAGVHERFMLRTARLGGFPSLEKARVLWLGVDEEPRLRMMAADLRRRLGEAGLPLDPKPFAPHITLARMKVPSDLRDLPSPPMRTFPADRMVLYRSRRLPEGARYEILAEAALLPSSTSETPP